MKYYEINENAARVSHDMMSFSSYKEGSTTASYRSEVNEAAELAQRAIEARPEREDLINSLLDRYSRRMAEYYNRESTIGCMCPSVLISGSGNFPTRKKQKQETACNSESMRQQATTEGTKTGNAVLPHIIACDNDMTTDDKTIEPYQNHRHIEPQKATHEDKTETDKIPEKQEVKQTEKMYKITDNEPETAPTVALLGHTDSGKAVSVNFKDTPHLLIAGATGAGKSVMLHSIICSLLRNNTTETAQLVLIDPKRVELFDYTDSQMLYGGRIYEDVSDAVEVLEDLTEVMNDRYIQLKYSHARNIDEMHGAGTMPRIYICIDELSFLMTCDKKKLENVISKIGMMGRAAGIHLIVCTQHPDRKTITGTIQANITAVVAMATRTATDSRMIAGSSICATLKGKGDSVLIDGLREERFQGRYISQSDIHEATEAQKKNEEMNHNRVDPSIMDRIKKNIIDRMKMN